jgi:hypothetical protein
MKIRVSAVFLSTTPVRAFTAPAFTTPAFFAAAIISSLPSVHFALLADLLSR